MKENTKNLLIATTLILFSVASCAVFLYFVMSKTATKDEIFMATGKCVVYSAICGPMMLGLMLLFAIFRDKIEEWLG